MEFLKIQYLKFIKVSGIETETAWAPVNAANLHLAHGARWNWLGGTNPPRRTAGFVTTCLSLWSTVPEKGDE